MPTILKNSSPSSGEEKGNFSSLKFASRMASGNMSSGLIGLGLSSIGMGGLDNALNLSEHIARLGGKGFDKLRESRTSRAQSQAGQVTSIENTNNPDSNLAKSITPISNAAESISSSTSTI